jgi:hypothetical protein
MINRFDLIFILVILVVISLFLLLNHIKKRKIIEFYQKSEKDPMLSELKSRLEPLFVDEPLTGLLQDLTREKLESIELREDIKESYTLNKKEIYMCLYRENGTYYNINDLLFVYAHEIAHVICPDEGHTILWEQTFNALLNEMIRRKIYNVDIPMTENYCGIEMK